MVVSTDFLDRKMSKILVKLHLSSFYALKGLGTQTMMDREGLHTVKRFEVLRAAIVGNSWRLQVLRKTSFAEAPHTNSALYSIDFYRA